MPSAGKYGTAVFEARRTVPKRDFFFLSDGTAPDIDHWAYYNLPFLGIGALSDLARAGATLGSCRIELPNKKNGFSKKN